MRHPELWHFPVSHYNEKARWALDFKGVPHRRVSLGATYLPRAWWKTRQGSLPILCLPDGRCIADSTRIIAELERLHPEPSLLPAEPRSRERALALEDWFDEVVGPAVRTWVLGALWEHSPESAFRLLATGMEETLRMPQPFLSLMRRVYLARHGIGPESRAVAFQQVRSGFDRIAAERGASGYLVGETFGVADLTAAALLGAIVQPPELECPAPLELFPEPLRARRDELAAHAGFEWVCRIYAKHRGASAEVLP